MRRTATFTAAGLGAGVVGWYGGLVALLALAGLDGNGWAPIAALGAASFAAGSTMAVLSRTSAATKFAFALGGASAGAVAGLTLDTLGADLSWVAAVGALLVVGLAVAAATLEQTAVTEDDASDASQSSEPISVH